MDNKLQQAKNEIAKELGYKDWLNFKLHSGYCTNQVVDKVAIRYNELIETVKENKQELLNS